MKRIGTIILSVLALMMIQGIATASVRTIPKDMTEESTKCISCHKKIYASETTDLDYCFTQGLRELP